MDAKVIIIAIILLFVILSVFIYARFIEPNKLDTTKYKLDIKGLESLKIVFFSDTHFGKLYSHKNMAKVRKKINLEQADIVIFGGDFFDHFIRDSNQLDMQVLSSELAKIEAKHKYAVFGNHDISTGAVRIYREFMNAGGFKVLENEVLFIEKLGIQIVGYDDALLGYTSDNLYDIDNDRFSIIINHEPDIVNRIKCKNEAIMLSGHTHGGQVKLPIITRFVLPELGSKYVYGKYGNLGKNKNISLFVSKGVGMTAFALRLFNTPEIISIEINQ